MNIYFINTVYYRVKSYVTNKQWSIWVKGKQGVHCKPNMIDPDFDSCGLDSVTATDKLS